VIVEQDSGKTLELSADTGISKLSSTMSSTFKVDFYVTVFTALHAMQTRSSDENSVCLYVCPAVCLSVTRVDCDKTVERFVQIYIPCERTFSLVSEKKNGWGATPST